MSQTLDLKPCPFCGCEKILDGFIRDGREIVCGECRASVAAFHPDASKRAAEKWNRRVKVALSSDDEETYQIGIRDGYSQAIQEIDQLTGGDGEYRYCTDQDPERHTPGPAEMIQRIVDRFETLNLLKGAEERGDFWDAPEPKPCGIEDPSTRDCPNMKEVGGGMDGERYRCAVCGKSYFLDYDEMR